MARNEDTLDFPGKERDAGDSPPRWRVGRFLRLALLAILIGLVAALLVAWFSRERITDRFVARELERLELPATYEVESIARDRAVLRNLVVGDPAHPDLTVERAQVALRLSWLAPQIGRITLEKPRLFGKYRAGKLSFGSLDPLIFTGSKEPFRLPDLDIAVVDGRGLLESDYGPLGIKVDGAGALRDGFAGTVAAIAPKADVAGCTVRGARLYGKVLIEAERPRFDGPLRLDSLACPGRSVSLAGLTLGINAIADRKFDGGEGRASLTSGALAAAGVRLAESGGKARFVYRNQAFVAQYSLSGKRLTSAQASAATMAVSGTLRSGEAFAWVESEGDLAASGVRLGSSLDQTLAAAATSAKDTPAGPILAQVRSALLRETRSGSINALFSVRQTGRVTALVVPEGTLRGASGAALLSLSRLQMVAGAAGGPRLTANFTTGGAGLPRVNGRMERRSGGGLVMRVSMPEYTAGTASLALDELMVAQAPGGVLGFAGLARITGDLPGGRADGLALPLDGNWSPTGGLTLWRKCVDLAFERLQLAKLSLDRRQLTVCPASGTAIVRSGPGGLRIAAGMPALDVSGSIGETPIKLKSGAIGLAWPGNLSATDLDVVLGPEATASRFRIAEIKAELGSDVAGTFARTDVKIGAVPIDMLDAAGNWRFADGALSIAGASFRVEDHDEEDRFQPLMARDATLTLADNVVTAAAMLREPKSGREIMLADIHHDLGNGIGFADLGIAGILFDKALQPDMLTRDALGVIANADGLVKGRGRIDWTQNKVTSSGSFTTESFDFAAAFGPVKDVSGTIAFTDLLGLITAPDQKLRIGSMNPGIEVGDGELQFELREGKLLAIEGGNWPFLDGRLIMQPAMMNIGVAETRRYTLDIEGLNAARFVERMELGNLAATGTFDGTLPLVFDENGGRIEGGMLRSRPPGGNVSYVGELSYKDLSTMANFAFDALRSIDYREMTIGMSGELEGEIFTQVRFTGVGQGKGARRNYITRQIAKLPLQFNVNLRAAFFQLISSFKSLYDPAFVRDPRTLGLMDRLGQPKAVTPGNQAPAPVMPATPQSDIQPPESRTAP